MAFRTPSMTFCHKMSGHKKADAFFASAIETYRWGGVTYRWGLALVIGFIAID